MAGGSGSPDDLVSLAVPLNAGLENAPWQSPSAALQIVLWQGPCGCGPENTLSRCVGASCCLYEMPDARWAQNPSHCSQPLSLISVKYSIIYSNTISFFQTMTLASIRLAAQILTLTLKLKSWELMRAARRPPNPDPDPERFRVRAAALVPLPLSVADQHRYLTCVFVAPHDQHRYLTCVFVVLAVRFISERAQMVHLSAS